MRLVINERMPGTERVATAAREEAAGEEVRESERERERQRETQRSRGNSHVGKVRTREFRTTRELVAQNARPDVCNRSRSGRFSLIGEEGKDDG